MHISSILLATHRDEKMFDLEGRPEQAIQHEPNNERVDEEDGQLIHQRQKAILVANRCY